MKTPDECNKQDFLAIFAQTVTESIKSYIAAGFSKTDAIDRVKRESMAGKKVWAIVLTGI